METNTLLTTMAAIANKLIKLKSIEDFTIHDAIFITESKATIPFIWMVRHSGTSMHRSDYNESLQVLREIIHYQKKIGLMNFCLFIYNGETLAPISLSSLEIMLDSQLKNCTDIPLSADINVSAWVAVCKAI